MDWSIEDAKVGSPENDFYALENWRNIYFECTVYKFF
jgi:hypothetical protein